MQLQQKNERQIGEQITFNFIKGTDVLVVYRLVRRKLNVVRQNDWNDGKTAVKFSGTCTKLNLRNVRTVNCW